MASEGAEEDARKLLAVLAGKEGAHEGRPVPAGPEDATAAGFGARVVYRVTRTGLEEAREG